MFKAAITGLMLVVCGFAGKPNDCAVPVQWTIAAANPATNQTSFITGDGKGAYVNGQSGVSATIDCGAYGILSISGTTRSVLMNFTQPLSTNSYTPAGLPGKTGILAGAINVRNLLYLYSETADYGFTTTLSVSPINIGYLRMLNPAEQAQQPQGSDFSITNFPNPDALVYVHHCPANPSTSGCPTSSRETWYVYPDPSAVGTLLVSVKSGKTVTDVNAGQFAMPFYFVISRL